VVVTDRVVTWTSSDATVARVSPAGVVSALAKGTATITAVSEGKPGSATVTVTVPAPVATVSVQPTTSNLTPGQTAALTATLADANGNVLSGRIVTWSSSDPGVATVSQSGVVTAVDAGGATISATSEGHSGGATVTVTVPVATITLKPTTLTIAPKQSEPLTATTTSANGTVLTGRLVTYTSSNTAVASVTSDGQVTGIASGTATITATSEGKSATAAVRVQPGPAAKIAMPTSLYLGRSTRVTLTATATDAFGNAIEGRAFTWTSSNTTVATVDQNGLVTAKKPGTVRITAAMDDQSAFTTVTVYDDGN
jgi:uncharacterized protein YjdB